VSLAPGSRLGPYEVSTLIGVGGMGEVYAATDVNLARPVAIKVLPDAVAADADRLARFEREARTLASLNHPNIAAIYGLERTGATTALVMELVEGQTLSDRILEGPIPIDEALAIAKQVAEALEAAHEHGVVHRDLKPANVKVRPDGRVKVLDFGLAKVVDSAATTSGTVSRSPTITTPAMTQSGVILGTAAYMSPEQARGKPVDKRADIWAFGCLLFEMLTGRRVFRNDEVSDTLAMVLTTDPDWSMLPGDTPASIRRLLRRSLVKDRGARLTDIGTARLEIDDARSEQQSVPPTGGSSSGSPGVRRPGWFALAAGALAVAAIATLATWAATRPSPIERPVTRALLGVAPAERLMTGQGPDAAMGMGRPSRTALAFTPDGRAIVFSAEREGRVQLFIRRLDALEATPIAGTDGASNLFLSPGGDSAGFYADGALKRVSLNGGVPVSIANVDLVFGASWGRDDRIVFATQTAGLWRIPASGGKPEPITELGPGEQSHRLPYLLPDGQTVLFTSTRAVFPSWDDTRIMAKSLVSGDQKVLVESGADARYVPTGHLIYMRRGTVMAVPFDAGRVEVTGAPVGLLANVMQAAAIQPVQVDSGAGQFAVSESGLLAYVTGGISPQDRWSIGWADRAGKFEPLNLPAGSYIAPRLSPDGKRIAYNTTNDDWDVWVYEVSRGLATRLPMEEEQSVAVWTPDSRRVVFTSRLSGGGNLLVRNADGNGAPETLPISLTPQAGGPVQATPIASTWTSDGSLVFWFGGGLWLFAPGGKAEPRQLISPGALQAEFSPDGRWLAYTSGRGPLQSQIYAQPYPAMDRREQVTGNSHSAVWRGNELFFIENPSPERPTNVRVMAVPVTTAPAFAIGTPRLLFEGPFRIDGPFRGYDVTADGQRFLMVRAIERPPERVSQMVFVQNWFEELRARVPAR
jgi:eukaryotic-like serine/threonine-protein kinase